MDHLIAGVGMMLIAAVLYNVGEAVAGTLALIYSLHRLSKL